MRTALLLSGQPRDLVASLDQIEQNYDIDSLDIFCHVWWSHKLIGTPFSSAQGELNTRVGVYLPNTLDLINQHLKPKAVLSEEPKEFRLPEEIKNLPEANQSQLKSIFYSMYTVNKLKQYYESIEGFNYDVVIRARYDLYYYQEVIPRKVDYGQIILPANHQEIRAGVFNGSLSMADNFIMADSSTMDIITSVYENFEDLYFQLTSTNAKPYGENYLGVHSRVNWNFTAIPDSRYNIEIYRNRPS